MGLNEHEIRQVVYSLISEIRYQNTEKYLIGIDNIHQTGNATSLNANQLGYEIQEKRLIELQRTFEKWLKEQSENFNRIEEGEEVIWEGPTNEAKDDAEMYCGNCQSHIQDDDWKYCPDCGTKILLHGRDIPRKARIEHD